VSFQTQNLSVALLHFVVALFSFQGTSRHRKVRLPLFPPFGENSGRSLAPPSSSKIDRIFDEGTKVTFSGLKPD
jgi:hypothetical protein